jgi:hypothetical protein
MAPHSAAAALRLTPNTSAVFLHAGTLPRHRSSATKGRFRGLQKGALGGTGGVNDPRGGVGTAGVVPEDLPSVGTAGLRRCVVSRPVIRTPEEAGIAVRLFRRGAKWWGMSGSTAARIVCRSTPTVRSTAEANARAR